VQAFAGICLIVSCITGAALGVRLLWVWWRTRMLPELSIGITAATLSVSGFLLLGISQIPKPEDNPLHLGILLVSLLLLATSSIALGVGYWRIFRPSARWAAGLCAAGSLLLLAWWGLAVIDGDSGLRDEYGLRTVFYYSGRLLIHGWGTWECFRYFGMMKRRVALGLADPVIAHQFQLWGWSGVGVVASVLVGVYASYGLAMNVLLWPVGLFLLSAFGLLSALTMWCAFFPPAFYRRRVSSRQPEAGA